MGVPGDSLELLDQLLHEGLISREQYDNVRLERMLTGRSYANILSEMGLLPANLDVKRFSCREDYIWKAQELQIPFVDLTVYTPDTIALASIPVSIVWQYNVLPIKKDGNALYVAMADVNNIRASDEIRLASRCLVRGVLAVPEHITEAIQKYYGAE